MNPVLSTILAGTVGGLLGAASVQVLAHWLRRLREASRRKQQQRELTQFRRAVQHMDRALTHIENRP